MRVVQACHVDVTSGHFGVTKTVARIKERFMWKGILRNVKRMVRFRLVVVDHLLIDAHSVYTTKKFSCNGYRNFPVSI